MSNNIVSTTTRLSTEAFTQMLNNPESSLREYNAHLFEAGGPLEEGSELRQKIEAIGRGETTESLTIEELNSLGSGAYNLWLINEVETPNGNITIDSAEFLAWQRDGADKPLQRWVFENDIAIISQKDAIGNGDQEINIEWGPEERRVVGGWRAIVSEPREGYYGELNLKDSTGADIINHDGKPDIYLTEEVHSQIAAGTAYEGTVIIKTQMEGENADNKIFFGLENVETIGEVIGARDLEASSFSSREYFDNDYNASSEYSTVQYEEYQQWIDAMKDDPSLASRPFAEWQQSQTDIAPDTQNLNAALDRFIKEGMDGVSENDMAALENLRSALGVETEIGFTNASKQAEALEGKNPFLSDAQYSNTVAKAAELAKNEDLSQEEKLEQLAELVKNTQLTFDTKDVDDIAAPSATKAAANQARESGIGF